MPTNSRGTVARQNPTQQVGYLRKTVTYADNGSVVTIGVLPAGALILKPISGAQVTTVFNAGTTNVLDLGTADDGDLFATDLALGALAFVPVDEAIGGFLVTEDTTVTATVALTGTAATTGSAEVVIAYIPDNG